MACDALGASHLFQGFEDRVFGQPEACKPFAFRAVGQPEQEVLGGDIFIGHAFRIAFRRAERVRGLAGEAGLAATIAEDLRPVVQFFLEGFPQGHRAAGDFGHDGRHHALVLLE